jgi:hypothetical protein
MSDVNCPNCGDEISAAESHRPDATVVRWLAEEAVWSGEAPTDEMYGDYLRSCVDDPVSRRRFVADLAYLGIHEVLDGDTRMLMRD